MTSLSGHSGHVLSMFNWSGAGFVSGGADKTVRFWDTRSRGCVNMVQYGGNNGSAVAACCVDPSGRLLGIILSLFFRARSGAGD